MTDKTTEFTKEQKELINEILNEKIEILKNAIIADLKAKIEDFEKIQKGAFENLATETLAGIVFLNKNLTDLQKSQILAILQGPKHDFTYFG